MLVCSHVDSAEFADMLARQSHRRQGVRGDAGFCLEQLGQQRFGLPLMGKLVRVTRTGEGSKGLISVLLN